MGDIIKTIVKSGYAEITEKKSRFIANVRPVKSEDEAKAFVEEMKKKYYDARHNVFAYQIGEKNELKRFSDDGEPQGTAGMPVLSVLTGGDIKNTAVVVTRYFGGILLGTGGLVRAYGKSAKLGIEAAGVAKIKHYKECRVVTDYTTAGKIQYEITNGEYILKDTLYSDKVEFIVMLDKDNENNFINAVKELSMGKAEIEITEEIYGAWLNNKMIVM